MPVILLAGAVLVLGPAGRAEQAPALPKTDPTGRIEGRVVLDADGQSAGDAEVILLEPPPAGQEYYTVRYPLRTTRVDDGGGFAFAGLPPGRYRVWANAGPLSSRTTRARGVVVVIPPAGDGSKPVELRLKPARTLTVRVRDGATGKPVAGAAVGFLWSDFPRPTLTGADGSAIVLPLTAESWNAEVRAEGYAQSSREINLEAVETTEAEFVLGPGGSVAGIIRGPRGQPVAGVGVSVVQTGSFQQVAYVESDRDGRYRLDHLPADVNLDFHVSRIDYLNLTRTATVPRTGQTLDFVVEPRPDGGSVAGLILGPDGKPVAGAEVSNQGDSSNHVRQTTTGPDGRYVLRNLFDSQLYGQEIYVRARGLAPQRLKVKTGPPASPGAVDVALEPGHRLLGRVVDERGRPVPDVRVDLSNTMIREFSGEQRTTGADGTFRFDSLPDRSAAPTRLRITAKGFSAIENREVDLDTAAPVDVALRVGGVVTGVAVDAATGEPIPSFNVRITFSRHPQPNAPAAGLLTSLINPGLMFQSPRGEFQIKDLVAGGTLQVTVSAPGFEREVVDPVPITRADEPVATRFELVRSDPANQVAYGGRLRDPSGRALPAVEVRLIAWEIPEPGKQRETFPSWDLIRTGQATDHPGVVRFLKATTDRDGRFRFDPVPSEAPVELYWWGQGVGPGRRADFEKRAEADRTALDLEIPPPARLAIRVDRQKYPTAATVQLNFQGSLFDYTSRPVPALGGEIVVEDLAAGTCQISLIPPYEADPTRPNGLIHAKDLAKASATLVPGQTVRVEFRD